MSKLGTLDRLQSFHLCVCWVFCSQHFMFYIEHIFDQIVVIFRIIEAYTRQRFNLYDFC